MHGIFPVYLSLFGNICYGLFFKKEILFQPLQETEESFIFPYNIQMSHYRLKINPQRQKKKLRNFKEKREIRMNQ